MRQFYFSYKHVKYDYSLLLAYAVSCGKFNISVNRDYMHAHNQGKQASGCLQQFSSVIETTVVPTKSDSDVIFCLQWLIKTLTCILRLS